MSLNHKVLVILGDGKLLGQQRANIQVFHALRSEGISPVFILGLRKETDEIATHLTSLGFSFERIIFPDIYNRGREILFSLQNTIALLRSNLSLCKLIRKFKPTHIHITNEINFRNYFLILLFAHKPIIYRIGDAPRQHHWVFRFIWKSMINPLTNKYVCVSQYVKDILITTGADEKKVSVIYSYPPVRSKNFSENIDVLETIRNDHNIIFIGQVSQHKGIDILIDACIELFKNNNNINLLVAGEFDLSVNFNRELFDKVHSSALQNRIIFLGNVNNLDYIMSISNLHVCPSVWDEPLSNTVVEAKSFSIPSIIFISGGLPEIINHKIDGYICDEKSVIGLIQGLSFFAMNREKTLLAGKEAKKSLDKFGITLESFHEKWHMVYADK